MKIKRVEGELNPLADVGVGEFFFAFCFEHFFLWCRQTCLAETGAAPSARRARRARPALLDGRPSGRNPRTVPRGTAAIRALPQVQGQSLTLATPTPTSTPCPEGPTPRFRNTFDPETRFGFFHFWCVCVCVCLVEGVTEFLPSFGTRRARIAKAKDTEREKERDTGGQGRPGSSSAAQRKQKKNPKKAAIFC